MFLCGDIKLGASYCVSLNLIMKRDSEFLTQCTARDRVALLLDQDSPFLELGAFAGFRNEDSTPCANLISGIGTVWFVQ
jgi:acetyl-CoA carboxylase carboxyltransferase component